MCMYNERIFERLAKAALESNNSWAKVAACIVQKNSALKIGVNRKKSHPFQAKYARNKDSIYLHAETQAIVNALRFLSLDELLKTDLYICRMKNINGNMVYGLAKPCDGCMRAITEFGIKNVYFTTDEGKIEKL
jgi:deoxycytidylate deaminase